MSAPRPVETEYLAPAEAALTRAVGGKHGPASFEFRLQVLEAASARFGGFDLAAFHLAFGVQSKKSAAELLELAAPVASAIERSSIHHALALSALAREALREQDRKNTGAYHTDFRLATRLAQLAAPKLNHKSKVIDPASGAGILLAALIAPHQAWGSNTIPLVSMPLVHEQSTLPALFAWPRRLSLKWHPSSWASMMPMLPGERTSSFSLRSHAMGGFLRPSAYRPLVAQRATFPHWWPDPSRACTRPGSAALYAATAG